MIIEVPPNWESCEIGEVTKVVGGGTPPSKDPTNFETEGGIPWITPADLSGYKNTFIDRGARNLSEKGFAACSAAKMPVGSVLFSSRAPIGYVAIAANEISTNQGFKSFVLPEELDSRFVYFYLRHIKPIAEAMATGTTFKELSGSTIAHLPLLIAPLPEQKRIADKLDTLFGWIDACRERLDRVQLILKRFRQSVLAAATSGQLTEDWRRQNGHIRDSWISTDFQSVCREITVGHVGKMVSEYRETGVPFLRSLNVRPFHFDPKDLKYISQEFHLKLSKSTLRPGDVVIVRSGAPGQCCVVPAELVEANCSDLVIVRPGPKLAAGFACVFINSEMAQSFVRSERVGVAQLHFNVGSMKNAPLLLPSLEEQQEIVRCVETLFAFADKLEARLEAARSRVERLTPATLAKAFRGELVPQDPNDEPASVLLERIQAARQSRVSISSTSIKRKLRSQIKTDKKPEVTMYELSEIQPNHLTNLIKGKGRVTAKALYQIAQLTIEDFYEQLRSEEGKGFLREVREGNESYLEAT
ncbi:MAG: Type-1 restriction enzyme EcoKI specificity protein [Syntrophorhabdus sp. PtaU1.Bin050]|nr:MAG: Type-1 restriction enzyme EcoKI specificity protein [Syntrophorhabdus sp. PtaU1.Bin050]